MPIFVSRFSPTRVAGGNLQGVRVRQNEGEARTQVGARLRERLAERTEEQEETRQERTSRAQEALPARTQQGERLAAQLQRGRTRADETQSETRSAGGTTDTDAPPVAPAEAAETGRRTVLPGVGALRTEADRDVERPGRLSREPANPIREQVLNRFARLRSLGRDGASAANDAVDETRGTKRLSAAGETVTAEEISRANTTPEIRQNLQADAGEVARGLQRDSVRQTQVNTRQTAQSSERVAETRRERVVSESRSEVQELRTTERRLERALQNTQREIRSERNRLNRAQSTASRSTTAAAAAIGTNVNILAT